MLEGSTSLTAIGTPNSNPGNDHPVPGKRQIGNDAGGVEAVFDGVDSGAGQGVENGLDNAGTLISNEGYAAGNLVPSKKQRKRQIGNDAGGVEAVFDGIDSGADRAWRTGWTMRGL